MAASYLIRRISISATCDVQNHILPDGTLKSDSYTENGILSLFPENWSGNEPKPLSSVQPSPIGLKKTRDYGNLSRRAFYTHKEGAKRRGIEFRFTYDEWKLWWETELTKIGPRAKRGVKRLNYGMCRFLDRGPYVAGNVYCGRPKQNKRDYCSSVYLNSPPLRINDAWGFYE